MFTYSIPIVDRQKRRLDYTSITFIIPPYSRTHTHTHPHTHTPTHPHTHTPTRMHTNAHTSLTPRLSISDCLAVLQEEKLGGFHISMPLEALVVCVSPWRSSWSSPAQGKAFWGDVTSQAPWHPPWQSFLQSASQNLGWKAWPPPPPHQHPPPDFLLEQLCLVSQSHGVGFTLPQHLCQVLDLARGCMQLLMKLPFSRGAICNG